MTEELRQSLNNLPEDFKPEELIGKLFADRYEIISLLGAGGMGAVYKAQHVYMKRNVAVKMLLPGTVLTESGLKRFRKEAQAASSLTHPNVVTVHEFDISEKFQTFMVMDFIEGHDLKEELDRNGPLSQDRFVHIFVQACAALAHAHKNGVIHRDIKDTNIMLLATEDDPDFVKIVDFGLARILGEEGDPAQRLTETGAWLGTPLFMSPEQCRGMKCDERSDIYSLGCVMYEALCGQLPFKADNMLDIMHKHVREFPPPMGVIAPEQRITRTMETLVSKCLAKEPSSRYQSMSELKAELQKLQSFNGLAGGTGAYATPAQATPGAVQAPQSGQQVGSASGTGDSRNSHGGSNSDARRSTSGSRKSTGSHSKEARRKARMLYWVAAIVAIGLCATGFVAWTILNAQNIASQKNHDGTTSGATPATVDDASSSGGNETRTSAGPTAAPAAASRRSIPAGTTTSLTRPTSSSSTDRLETSSRSTSAPEGAASKSQPSDAALNAGTQPGTARSTSQPASAAAGADPNLFNNDFFNQNPFERSAPTSRHESTISQPAQPAAQPASSTPSSETPQSYPPAGYPQPPAGHPFPPPGFPPPPLGPDGKPPPPPPGAPLTR